MKLPDNKLDRRKFLKLTVGAGTFSSFGLSPSRLLAYSAQGGLYRSLIPEGASLASKGINPSWLSSIQKRESSEPVYTKAANQLRYIGMPVGGIGCGTLYLGGDGKLWLWDVWHNAGEGIRARGRIHNYPNGTSAGLLNRDGLNYMHPINTWESNPPADETPYPFDQGFAVRTVINGQPSVHNLDRSGFSDITFSGSYPQANVKYADASCPLKVELTCHPIFIPLNTPDSALPATVMEYTLSNPGANPVEATIVGWMQNPVSLTTGLNQGQTRVNNIRSGPGYQFLECTLSGSAILPFAKASDYTVFADFEGTNYGGWTTTGSAFGSGPVNIAQSNTGLGDVRGVGSKFVNTWLTNNSDVPIGELRSPVFTITRFFIHFLLGGGPVTGIRVRLIDANNSSELRITSNTSQSNTMKWCKWDVSDLIGRSVRILVEDLSSGSWGQLGFDHVCFSDTPLAPEYIVYEDFERTSYSPWTTTGTAFGSGPVLISGLASYLGNVGGYGTRVVNTHASSLNNDGLTGTLVSPTFTITHGYIHFLQGGGSNAAQTRVRLLRASDNSELRIQTGNNTSAMTWRTFDVLDLRGQNVKISIEDLSTGGWGNIGVDQIIFSTNPTRPPAVQNLNNEVDRGNIGIAELGQDIGRVSSANAVSTSFPWLTGKSADTGAIGRTLTLAPGATATVRFAVTWYFPNLTPDIPVNRREYVNRFADAYAVANYLTSNWTRLVGDTRLWVETWKDSSLPYWFLDRALVTANTIATTNCFYLSNGRFFGYEGVNCCTGTCTHVWYYAQTLAYLFPDIERSMRQNVDLNSSIALASDGKVKFRGEYNNDWAWDGQCGTVLRSYREHLASPNNAFLTSNWANIKKVLDALIFEDGNSDGVSEARQHNTLDADWFGRVPAHIGLYAAALRAGHEMAKRMGNLAYATTCQSIATAAMARMSERFVSNSNYGEGYYVQQMASNVGQLGQAEGCYIDQVLGELYAQLTNLPRVTDKNQCLAALRSIWRFSYSHDLTAFLSTQSIKQGRPFQNVGEGGLLVCTFPNDGNVWANSWQSVYFAECMTGFEYQVAAHSISEGLVDQGLIIMRAVYDRYHASKRNPFNEVECSDHYARAMASYACFLTASGYRHNGPEGMLGFAPKMGADNFKCAFTTAEGWGSYVRVKVSGRVRETITLKRGTLRLRTFECEVPAGTVSYLARATRNGSQTTASFSLVGNILRCTMLADLNLASDDTFEIIHATVSTPLFTDSDGDGLTDLEEMTGIDDTVSTPAYNPRGFSTDSTKSDSDGDGTSDGVESRLGTSPLDSREWFQIQFSLNSQSKPEMKWPTREGLTFTIQRSNDLTTWQSIVNSHPSTAVFTTYTDLSAPQNSSNLFYRVGLNSL